jgi:hypothetical protein
MKRTDKYLIGIVVGIVLLVIVAFLITLVRPEPTYQAGDTPEGVAHNYLLALQKGEYDRAYGYLSPSIEGYPTSEEMFIKAVQDYSWQFRHDQDITLTVESAQVTGDRATTRVRESRFRGGNLFDSSQSTTTFEVRLQLESGEWRIVDSRYYFAWCWRNDGGCE